MDSLVSIFNSEIQISNYFDEISIPFQLYKALAECCKSLDSKIEYEMYLRLAIRYLIAQAVRPGQRKQIIEA
jgi:hypothetical protein